MNTPASNRERAAASEHDRRVMFAVLYVSSRASEGPSSSFAGRSDQVVRSAVIVAPYARALDRAGMELPSEQLYRNDDKWVARMVSENQHVMPTRLFDAVYTLFPHWSIFICCNSIRSLVRRNSGTSRPIYRRPRSMRVDVNKHLIRVRVQLLHERIAVCKCRSPPRESHAARFINHQSWCSSCPIVIQVPGGFSTRIELERRLISIILCCARIEHQMSCCNRIVWSLRVRVPHKICLQTKGSR